MEKHCLSGPCNEGISLTIIDEKPGASRMVTKSSHLHNSIYANISRVLTNTSLAELGITATEQMRIFS